MEERKRKISNFFVRDCFNGGQCIYNEGRKRKTGIFFHRILRTTIGIRHYFNVYILV